MNSAKYMDKCMEQKVGLQTSEPGGRHSSSSSTTTAECEAKDPEMLSHGCQDLSPSQNGGKNPNKLSTKLRGLEGLSSEISLRSLSVF